MHAYALVGLTYLNEQGAKKKAPAGAVFGDFLEDDFEDWKERGWAREATVGEIAEAGEAAGSDKSAKAGKPKASKSSKASKSEKPAEEKDDKEDLA